MHGCQYCYATTKHDKAIENRKLHNPNSPFLLGDFPTSFTVEQREEKLKMPQPNSKKNDSKQQPILFNFLD